MQVSADVVDDPPGFDVETTGRSVAPLSLSQGNGSFRKGFFLTLVVFLAYSLTVYFVIGMEPITEPGSRAAAGLHDLVHIFFDRDAAQLWWVLPMMAIFAMAQQVRTLGGVILAALVLYPFKSGAIDLHTMF